MRRYAAVLASLFTVAFLVGACDQPDTGGQPPADQMPQSQPQPQPQPME